MNQAFRDRLSEHLARMGVTISDAARMFTHLTKQRINELRRVPEAMITGHELMWLSSLDGDDDGCSPLWLLLGLGPPTNTPDRGEIDDYGPLVTHYLWLRMLRSGIPEIVAIADLALEPDGGCYVDELLRMMAILEGQPFPEDHEWAGPLLDARGWHRRTTENGVIYWDWPGAEHPWARLGHE